MNLARDLRYAFRQLRRAPAFAATAVFTLALGIGTSSAIFCLIDALWLHPMHVPNAGRIARIFSTTPQEQEGLFTYNEYRTMAQRVRVFQGSPSGLVAIGARGSMMPRNDGTSTMLLTNVVSSNFFTVMGVHPLLGRIFSPEDAAQLRTHPGVILGYHCWQHEFNGDPNIIGRQIPILHGKDRRFQIEVWGVLPPWFREIDPDSDRDLWIPIEDWEAIGRSNELSSHEFRWFQILGRLAPGASIAQANDQVSAVATALAAADPPSNRGRSARAISDFDYRMSRAGTSGLVLFAIVIGVVLLAVVNVAHLLFSRALARAPELALRLSLGARRWTILRQLLLENLILGILSLSAALLLAAALIAIFPRLLVLEPAILQSYGSGMQLHLDLRVYVIAALLAFFTMLFLALVPLSQIARSEILPVLQAVASTRTAGKQRIPRRVFVWFQIGISFALLVSTGALVRSFLNTRTQNIGITRNQVLVAFTQDPDTPMRDAVLGDLRKLPGVERAAYAIRSPLMLSEGGIAAKALFLSHPEIHDPIEIKYNAVSPEFLSLVGTRILKGRGFTSEDDAGGPPTVVISQAMAHKFWPTGDAIDQLIHLPAFFNGKDLDVRVIGIAENAPINHVGEIPEPYMYLPFHFSQMGEITFVVETQQNAMALAQSARQVFIHANPLLDPMMITSLPELTRYSAGNYQMMAELVSSLGLIGLLLTIVGLYGFLAFRVNQRRREIGIRMALGASRRMAALLVVQDTAQMTIIGLSLGILLAIAATRLETAVLFGVHAIDAISLIVAALILVITISLATWMPARRAASVDPMQALRTE